MMKKTVCAIAAALLLTTGGVQGARERVLPANEGRSNCQTEEQCKEQTGCLTTECGWLLELFSKMKCGGTLEGNIAEQPEADVTKEPEADVTKEPEADVTKEPEADVTEKPEADVTKKPEATVTEKPKATVTEKPKATVTEKPKATVTEKPKADVTKKPKATVTEKPKADVTKKPETGVTKKPEAAVTKKPEATVTEKPKADVTKKPEATVTEKPECPGGFLTDNSGWLEELLKKWGYTGGNATEQPKKPEADVTKKPEATVTQKPEQKPEVQDQAYAYGLRITELVNQYRAEAGLSPVEYSGELSKAAQTRAFEIEESFSHTRPDGRYFSTVLKDYGISYRYAGENIAWGQRSPEEVVKAWMNSPGHRANILNKSFTKLGVGYQKSSGGVNYFTQLFTN